MLYHKLYCNQKLIVSQYESACQYALSVPISLKFETAPKSIF